MKNNTKNIFLKKILSILLIVALSFFNFVLQVQIVWAAENEDKIQASDKAANDYFWSAIAMSDDWLTAIVWAWWETTWWGDAWAAYIYRYSWWVWTEQEILKADNAGWTDEFWKSVAISSDWNTVIVWSKGEDTWATNAWAAYIFRYGSWTWTQQDMIQSTDKQQDDYFWNTVAISDDWNTALVWAYRASWWNGTWFAYVFSYSWGNWTEDEILSPSDWLLSDNFWKVVHMSDDWLVAMVWSEWHDTW